MGKGALAIKASLGAVRRWVLPRPEKNALGACVLFAPETGSLFCRGNGKFQSSVPDRGKDGFFTKAVCALHMSGEKNWTKHSLMIQVQGMKTGAKSACFFLQKLTKSLTSRFGLVKAVAGKRDTRMIVYSVIFVLLKLCGHGGHCHCGWVSES